ncbi:hypothetical protein Fmac_028598 [Flemingia macrophylla]|uniref:Uncharacterized protein n=1 Tax=Flemingia macrophylla TaxID=520843 RepID=A0ABD1L7Y6_9FABA
MTTILVFFFFTMSGVDEHPEAYAANTYSKPSQQRETRHLIEKMAPNSKRSVQEMMPLSLEEFMMWLRDTSTKTRKLEGKLDALVNLVTRLGCESKLPLVARVCGIRPSNDHHTSVCTSSRQSGVDEGVHDVATDTSTKTRKLEGKVDALVNLVTQLAPNQKPASVARVCGICSSNDHHTSVCPSSQQSELTNIRGLCCKHV